MDEPNSRNLFDFTATELQLAGKLLSAFRSPMHDHTRILGDIITPEKNPTSGFVFLSDTNFNCALLNGQFLEDWFRCTCQREGFWSQLHDDGDACCRAYLIQEIEKVKAA